LGRLALRRGDAEGAKEHLLASAEVKGSPVLNSFGPSMSLARDLLQAGERDAVLAYLERCSRFWKDDSPRVWSEDIRAGRTPRFTRLDELH
jgi:hypothetical protein